MAALRIALVSSEVAPFAKTGGLADVTAALAAELSLKGHEVRVFMPLYRRVARGAWARDRDPRVRDVPVESGGRTLTFGLEQRTLPGSRVRVDFVDCPELYDRDELYTDGVDEPLRFAFLARAVLTTCQWRGWSPDIIHCNDWHTGLLPLYLRTLYGWDELFSKTKTLMALHNLGYQGVFSSEVVPALHLERERHLLHAGDLEGGVINFLKTGLLYADRLSTVSETYAREIQTAECGMGLEEILRDRAHHLVGIVNGIDTSVWSPEVDSRIAQTFTADDLEGKRANRDALLSSMNLPANPSGPVFGVVSRLTGQKGFEVFPDVLPVLCEHHDVRIVLLGSGEEKYEEYFRWLMENYPSKVAFRAGYDETLAHQIEAGSDVFLMPSRYEPCGLNQMYSLAYGTIPLVRQTGGLADTVKPYDRASNAGTGFLFRDFTSEAFQAALEDVLRAFADREGWQRLVRRAMAEDWSWARATEQYESLYRSLAES